MSNAVFTIISCLVAIFRLGACAFAWSLFIFLFRFFASPRFNEKIRREVLDWLNGKK